MKIKNASIAYLLLSLAISITACSGQTQTASTTPTTSIPATQLPLPSLTASPTENPIRTLGQLVEIEGFSIVMVRVAFDSDQLQVMFAAKNTGPAVVSLSPVLFSATTSAGGSLKWSPCMVTLANNQKKLSSAAPFSGNLQEGEILKGTICWDGATQQNGNQVGYASDYGGPAAVIWDVSTAGKADVPAALTANTFKTPPHVQGDTVTLKDISVTFDKVTLTGYLNAYFTVKNNGNSAYKFIPPLAASQLSPPLDDSFSYRLADGSPLTGGIFMNSPCQDVSTSIEVPPGQTLSLDMCFGNYDPILSVAPGSLVSFFPSADQGEQVNWLTK